MSDLCSITDLWLCLKVLHESICFYKMIHKLMANNYIPLQ